MKTLAVLSIALVSSLTLSSFTTKTENKPAPVKMQLWKALCADGSVGGYFECDCSQTRANAIAHVMCN